MAGAGPYSPGHGALAEHPAGRRVVLEAERIGAPGQDVVHVIKAGLLDFPGRRFLGRRLRAGPNGQGTEEKGENGSGQRAREGPLRFGHGNYS
jgi:hypothetical protein